MGGSYYVIRNSRVKPFLKSIIENISQNLNCVMRMSQVIKFKYNYYESRVLRKNYSLCLWGSKYVGNNNKL